MDSPDAYDCMADRELPDWDGIVERHAKRVLRVALRILGSVQDAEDVSTDVFTEAFRLHKTGPVQSSGRLAGATCDLAFHRSATPQSAVRRTARMRQPVHRRAIRRGRGFGVGAVAQSAVAQLPDQQATVFVMYHFERLTRDEVSATLGISLEAVSTTLYKARQRLLTQLAVFNRGDLE